MAAPILLERDAALTTLTSAVRDAASGDGCAVLVTGEAGIGKTTLVHAFVNAVRDQARVLSGACDDLLTPRALGPLRDAAAGTSGPLYAALTEGPVDAVFGALRAELRSVRPSVLLIEDLHWSDGATLDVLGYVVRRLRELPTVVVLTYRDNAIPAGHPVHRLLGALAGYPAHRLALRPLSSTAVRTLANGSRWDATALHQLTGGNPFFVTEVLAAPDADVPATVAEAVLARYRQLGERCREAVEQLCVVPTVVEFPLAETLLGERIDALAEAEERGILEVRADGLAFRHELARRAVEQSLPRLRRRGLHRRVVAALREAPRRDLARLVHHATQADDAEAVTRFAPQAGREAAGAGSHREALAHFAAALRHAHRLEPADLARLLDDHAWELYNARRFTEAVAGSERAVTLYREQDDPIALGEALVRLSRHRYMAGDPTGAEDAAEQALRALERWASPPAVAYAATYQGSVFALTGRTTQACAALARAQQLAERAERLDLVALCLNYQSIARPGLDGEGRLALLRESLRIALEHGFDEAAARGYTNLGELLYRFNRLDELQGCLDAGQAFTRERGFWSHSYNLDVHRCLLAVRRGDWASAEEGLRALLEQDPEPGMLALYSLPPYARLLARRGSPDAEPLLRSAWDRARRQRLLLGLSYAGAALVEWAWLCEQPDTVAAVLDEWRPHATRPGAEPAWAELLRYAGYAGLSVEAFPGCPEPWAAGLRGDWRAAAAGWAELGDPYERALELAASGEVGATLEALRVLEELDAEAATGKVRRRLRALGVHRRPRGASASTRSNPAGLTQRQLDVLALVADGLTNAEIANRLRVSVRTVDTHVAAMLAKLGVNTRRAAAVVARSWDHAGSVPR